jgi:hypothetical protein
LAHPLYLKPESPSRLTITIPEERVAPPRDWYPAEFSETVKFVARRPPAEPGSLQEELNEILGPLALTRPSSSIGDDYQLYLEAIEDRPYTGNLYKVSNGKTRAQNAS